jgi:hypothetical protein
MDWIYAHYIFFPLRIRKKKIGRRLVDVLEVTKRANDKSYLSWRNPLEVKEYGWEDRQSLLHIRFLHLKFRKLRKKF